MERNNPVLLIIGGPNGSGKSTVYRDAAFHLRGRSFWIINPDELAKRISIIEDMELNKANAIALDRMRTWLDSSIAAHQTVGVETVLSTDKYRSLVAAAKRLRYEVWLFYVMLNSPELNISRVADRVMKGGHDVPPEKIITRYQRSLDQLPWYLNQADYAVIFDNSAEQPCLMAEKRGGTYHQHKNILPVARNAILCALNEDASSH